MRIIAGKYKNKRFAVPSAGTRPTVSKLREAVFNMCQGKIEGALVLDLFAGSGGIGFEALSRGAAHVTYVEHHRAVLRLLRQNIATLGVTAECTIYPLAVEKAIVQLVKLEHHFDLIYLDPPYGEGLAQKTVEQLDHTSLLAPDGVLLVEDSDPLEGGWRQFRKVDERRVGRALLTRLVFDKHIP